MIFSKPKCLACIDNQISLPMVLRYNEIYYFLRVDGPITRGGIGGGERVALKVFPSTSTLRFFLVCNRDAEGHDRGLFKF